MVDQSGASARRTLVRLVFAYHLDRLVAGNRTRSSPERAEMLTCVDPPLDRPMVLFQYIVEILRGSMSTVLLQSALGFELLDGRRITGVPVGVDHPW